MTEPKYNLIISRGVNEDYILKSLDKKEFIRETSSLLKKPKRIFLGLGDFLEVGDYNSLLNSIFFSEEDSINLETILDQNNRRISEEGIVPISFYKLAVYFPDFLLKDVPLFCVSAIGKNSRLFPGAEIFVKYIKEYDPVVLSAIPYEIAIEIVKRLDLDERNLIATKYKTKLDENNKEVYSGDIDRFISGDVKSSEIKRSMAKKRLKEEEVVYIGRGEAGVKTFSTINSIAFNPSENIIPQSRITLYGSALESLLVLFNFEGELENFLLSKGIEKFLPSLVVYSDYKEKSRELIDIELKHLHLQKNIIGQRIEYSGDSYKSVEREIDVAFGGSSINIKEVREIISKRIETYKDPQDLVKKIYHIAKERYKKYLKAAKK